MVQINDDFHENLTLEKLDQIIAEYAQKTPTPTHAGNGQSARSVAASSPAHSSPAHSKD
jgi:hypothetical protein